jgi:hypothetical protein
MADGMKKQNDLFKVLLGEKGREGGGLPSGPLALSDAQGAARRAPVDMHGVLGGRGIGGYPALLGVLARDQRRGDSRYRQFCEHISQQFQNGRRFSHDFPHELVANDTELDARVDASTGSTDKDAKC